MNDYLQQEIEYRNSIPGELNLEDGIECPKCLNRGFVTIVSNGKYLAEQSCECMKARITTKRLRECGIPKETLEQYTFKNYIVEEEWQKKLKETIVNYLKEENNNWLALSGKTGAGKTHLCIATYKYLIVKRFKRGEYISWNAEIPKLLALSKSTYIDNQEKFEERINYLSNVDVLYIDDLFKLTSNKYGDEETLSLAYRILNNRYLDKTKITIISTEFFERDIASLDEAVWGRIHERCSNGATWLSISNEDSRNYRAR